MGYQESIDIVNFSQPPFAEETIKGLMDQEAKAKLEVQYQLRPLTATEEEQLNRLRLLIPYIDKAHQFLADEHRSLL